MKRKEEKNVIIAKRNGRLTLCGFLCIVLSATKVMYRGVSAGIILSVVSLYVYDLNIPEFNYGAAIDSLNLVCLILLVVGSEIYHRVSLHDASFETVYPEVDNFFDDYSE